MTALLQVVAEYGAQSGGRGVGTGPDLSSLPLWLSAAGALTGLWLLLGARSGVLQRLVGLALLGAAVYFGAPAAGFATPW